MSNFSDHVHYGSKGHHTRSPIEGYEITQLSDMYGLRYPQNREFECIIDEITMYENDGKRILYNTDFTKAIGICFTIEDDNGDEAWEDFYHTIPTEFVSRLNHYDYGDYVDGINEVREILKTCLGIDLPVNEGSLMELQGMRIKVRITNQNTISYSVSSKLEGEAKMKMQNLAATLLEDATTAKVVFQTKGTSLEKDGVDKCFDESSKQYTYKVSRDLGLEAGDCVVVDVVNGGESMKVCRVISIDDEADIDIDRSKGYKWIAGKVDVAHFMVMQQRENEIVKALENQRRKQTRQQAKAALLEELGVDSVAVLTDQSGGDNGEQKAND